METGSIAHTKNKIKFKLNEMMITEMYLYCIAKGMGFFFFGYDTCVLFKSK